MKLKKLICKLHHFWWTPWIWDGIIFEEVYLYRYCLGCGSYQDKMIDLMLKNENDRRTG